MSKASSCGWFVVVTLLALSGCSSSSTPSGAGGSGGTGGTGGSGGSGGSGANLPNPCTLVPSAELGAIVDIELVRTELDTGFSGEPSCLWYDADEFAVFQVGLWRDLTQYNFSVMQSDSSPVSGVGEEAHLGSLYTVNVKMTTNSFFTQALNPVADGQISAEVRASAKGTMMSELGEYEAAFRAAKLVESRL